MICAVIALIIANSPLHHTYEHFLHTDIGISLGDSMFSLSIHHWINEALMAMFFFIMGLELKRELMVGELSSPKQALLPIMAAIGGMVIPALFYVVVNLSTPGISGWGIPMATDIAFAIGALSLLGARVPKNLITFLIALAIVDDLGAVAVIALFYTESIDLLALACAGGFTLVLLSFNLGGIRRPLPYAAVGVLLWAAMLASGIHATIAGILVAFVIPIRPKFEPAVFVERVKETSIKMQKAIAGNADIIHNNRFRALVTSLGDGVQLVQAPAQRLEHSLHLPVAYLVIPIFALANAGIPVDFSGFRPLFTGPYRTGRTGGPAAGQARRHRWFYLVNRQARLGKPATGLNMKHILGVGLLGGIGFTMSIFIADLGFAGRPEDLLMAKTGILLASAIAGLGGFFWLMLQTREHSGQAA